MTYDIQTLDTSLRAIEPQEPITATCLVTTIALSSISGAIAMKSNHRVLGGLLLGLSAAIGVGGIMLFSNKITTLQRTLAMQTQTAHTATQTTIREITQLQEQIADLSQTQAAKTQEIAQLKKNLELHEQSKQKMLQKLHKNQAGFDQICLELKNRVLNLEKQEAELRLQLADLKTKTVPETPPQTEPHCTKTTPSFWRRFF